jgi:hypothetical protein
VARRWSTRYEAFAGVFCVPACTQTSLSPPGAGTRQGGSCRATVITGGPGVRALQRPAVINSSPPIRDPAGLVRLDLASCLGKVDLMSAAAERYRCLAVDLPQPARAGHERVTGRPAGQNH